MARPSHARDRAIIEQMLQDVRSPDLAPHGPAAYVIPLAPGVRLHFQKAGSMLTLSILLDETSSLDKLKTCWDDIAAWRDQLAAWQGPSSMGNRYLAMLDGWHKVWQAGKGAKPSAADLASWVNNEVAGNFEDFFFAARYEGHGIDLAALLAEHSPQSVPVDHWAFFYYAVSILEIMGLSRDDIRAACEYALENLQHARPACLPDYPITRHHIIARLKTYRRRWR
jgi:hypothetical protein